MICSTFMCCHLRGSEEKAWEQIGHLTEPVDGEMQREMSSSSSPSSPSISDSLASVRVKCNNKIECPGREEILRNNIRTKTIRQDTNCLGFHHTSRIRIYVCIYIIVLKGHVQSVHMSPYTHAAFEKPYFSSLSN